MLDIGAFTQGSTGSVFFVGQISTSYYLQCVCHFLLHINILLSRFLLPFMIILNLLDAFICIVISPFHHHQSINQDSTSTVVVLFPWRDISLSRKRPMHEMPPLQFSIFYTSPRLLILNVTKYIIYLTFYKKNHFIPSILILSHLFI